MANAPQPHRIALIPEHASKQGGRLGRHIHFDDRSWNYRVPLGAGAGIQTRTWPRTMKALKDLGSTTDYHWCFGLEDVLKTRSTLGPVEVGLNWYEGFDKPDAKGLVKIGGAVRGGHAFELLGVDAEKKLVWAINSWGPDWGLGGRFAFSWKDLERLLHEDGEASTVNI